MADLAMGVAGLGISLPGLVEVSSLAYIAQQLSRAVFYIHTSKLVHKNIQPETILLFSSELPFPHAVGTPYLVGFDNIRKATASLASTLSGRVDWDCRVYTHPKRQRGRAAEYYGFQHDVYSLGVVLLELAFWESFVVYDGLAREFMLNPNVFSEKGAKVLTRKLKDGKEGVGEKLKRMLVSLVKRSAGVYFGERYAKVVGGRCGWRCGRAVG